MLFWLNRVRTAKTSRLVQYVSTIVSLLAYKYPSWQIFRAAGQHVASNYEFPIRIGNSQFDSIWRSDFRKGYEVEIQALIASQRNDDSDDALFVDVGSNWGHHSFDSVLTGHFRVQAFDTNPVVCEDFREVAKALRCTDRAKIDSFAITNIDGGYASFHVPILKSGIASIYKSHLERAISNSRFTTLLKKILKLNDYELRVPLRTLDSMKLNSTRVLKVDIEGVDLECIDGARLTIAKQLPAIVIEWQKQYSFQSNSKNIIDFLFEQGYNFFKLEKQLMGYDLLKVDILEVTSRENLLILRPEHIGRLQNHLNDLLT